MIRQFRNLGRQWSAFWFRPQEGRELEVIRIGLGLTLLWHYVALTPQLLHFYGESGVLPLAALNGVREALPWQQSLLYYWSNDAGVRVVHGLTVLALMGFTLGWRTAWCKVLVLLGHISFLHRNPGTYYGVDNIATSLLFVLCWAPVGRWWSLDARGKGRAEPSVRAGICRRLLQVQMATVYLMAGLEKLRGDTWWSGDAVWIAMNNWEFAVMDPGLFARHYTLINLLTYGTLVFEISYAFLVWRRAWTPWIVGGALLLHLGIGAMMGLWLFAFVMMLGNLSFLPFGDPRDQGLDDSKSRT